MKKSHIVVGFNKVDYTRKSLGKFPLNFKPMPAGQSPIDLTVTKRILPGKTGESIHETKPKIVSNL